MTMKFVIDGKPQAKQSFKVGTVTTKDGRTFATQYTPMEMKYYANLVKMMFRNTYPKHLPSVFYDVALAVTITVHVAIPKSYSNKKKGLALKGSLVPKTKPDCDNIAKNICDALNEVAWPDDKQIARLLVKKVFDENPFVEVEIDAINSQCGQNNQAEQMSLLNGGQ